MTNLFNLNQDYKELLDMMEQGIDPEVLKDTMESIESSIDVKVDNTVGLIRSVEGDVETVEKEIKRLQTVKKQKQNFTKMLKTLLQDMLDYRQLQNYRTTTNYIYKRKNAPSKSVTDEKLIPKEYWVSQAPKLNSKQLTEDLKAGKEVPGAELKVTESLVIK